MSRVRIVLLTTVGPAEIERITEEDPEVASVICLSGKAVSLPVSRAYDAFVREPTGVIQRHFGHPAYRIDVAAPISEGFSWQLGVFAAHALADAGRLAGKHEPAERVVWATGEIDRDLNVLAIDHLVAKLDRAALPTPPSGVGPVITLLAPTTNVAALDDAWLAARGLGPDALRKVGVTTVNEMLVELGLTPLAPRLPAAAASVPAASTRRQARPHARMAWWFAGAVVVLTAAVAGARAAVDDLLRLAETVPLERLEGAIAEAAAGGTAGRLRAAIVEAYLDWSRPRAGAIEVQVIERRAPEGFSCAAVAVGRVAAVAQSASDPGPDRFRIAADGLCGLDLRVQGAADHYLMVLGQAWAGGRGGGAPDSLHMAGPEREFVTMQLDPPRRAALPLDQRQVVLAASRPLDGADAWWDRHVIGTGVLPDGSAWRAAVKRLNRLGVTVREIRQHIES